MSSIDTHKATKLALKLHVHPVQCAYTLASTRHPLLKTSFNSHLQDQARGTARKLRKASWSPLSMIRILFSRSIHLNVIGVTKEDSKTKSMLCSTGTVALAGLAAARRECLGQTQRLDQLHQVRVTSWTRHPWHKARDNKNSAKPQWKVEQKKHTDETYHIISEVMDVLCVWLAQFSRQSSQTTLLKV
eukprot:1158753-Pelagomonas_calceolata.AAC.8